MDQFTHTTTNEVRSIILKSTNASCDLDPFPTRLLKHYIDDLIVPITAIINLSMREGVVPPFFKQALVTPLIKNKTLCGNEFKNYRPISNLSFLSKILDKIVAKRLNAHIEEHLLSNHVQSSYKRFHSTETALLNINNDIICNMDNGKVTALTLLDLSTAFDTIDQVVKKVVSYIAKPLSDICNKSFTQGVFPDNMKIGKVIPLYKAGDRNVFSNYRPIPLLSQFSKILEKLFNERLDKFIDKCNVLNNSQYGFRNKMCTTHALINLVEEISSSLDAKKFSIGVFIDLKKAFDTVNHALLIDKLEFYGVRGPAKVWLKSYLHNRKQFVQIDDCKSTLLNVTCGVPQGSILGPKLFILYINDICNVSKIVMFILFADDTNVFYSDHDINNVCTTMSNELDKLYAWFTVNKLSLNISKTNYILFGRRRCIADNVSITMGKSPISRVKVNKFLGVNIDENLTWKDHISVVKSKLSKTIGIMYRASTFLNQSSLFTLYCSLFLPYMTYCLEIWGNTYKSNTLCIFILQKKVLRIIIGANRYDHTNCIFYNLRILKFYDLVKLRTSVIMYQARNNTLPVSIQHIFTRYEGKLLNTRQQIDFVDKFARTNVRAMSMRIVGVKLWNALDHCLKNSKTRCIFSKFYKENVLRSYYYNDHNTVVAL